MFFKAFVTLLALSASSALAQERLSVQFLGNTTLVFDNGETRVLIDGFLSRPGIGKYALGVKVATKPDRVERAIKAAELKDARAIFVAHAHFDHAMDVAYMANRFNAMVYGSQSTRAIARAGKVAPNRIEILRDGQTYKVGTFKVTAIYSPHSDPNRFPGQLRDGFAPPARMRDFLDDQNFSFLFETGPYRALVIPGGNYLAGNLDKYQADIVFLGTGGINSIAARAKKRGDPDFYETYWHESVTAVGAKMVVPIHWDNFFKELKKGEKFKTPPRIVEDFGAAKKELDRMAGKAKIPICWLETPFLWVTLDASGPHCPAQHN